MSDSQRSKNEQDYSSSSIFDNIPLFEQNEKSQANIFLNSSLSKIGNLFSLIKNKLLEIKEKDKRKNNVDFSKNFEKLKKSQINLINNSININDLNYIYIMKLLNSEIILYDFLNGVFLEEYINFKDNICFNIMKNITYNIITNYNILVEMVYKLTEKLELMNGEIKQLNDKIEYNYKYEKKKLIEHNIFLGESLNKKQIENNLINKKLRINKFNNTIYNNSNYLNNTYTKNALKNKILNKRNNIINNINFKNKSHNQRNNSYRNNSDNILNDSNQQYINITNLYLTGNRKFTLKMLKDIIYNIYDAKELFNKKCIENKSQKETLEQFMYTYLNNKYGLKNMVIEWATNIINGIKNYSLIDNEICLFGKILRNELDESCHMIMPQIKKNVNDILINILKKEYTYKNDNEIMKLKNKLISKRLSLNFVQIILNNLYSKEDQEKIIPKINEYKYKMSQNGKELNNTILYDFNCKNNKDNNYHNKLTRIEINKKLLEKENEINTIDYNNLLQIFLEFQMDLRENYLKPFVDLFKSVDDDNDGIINETQFINLIKKMNIFDDNILDIKINKLLNAIDPYGDKHIIFSDCVDLFSYKNDVSNESILDKIYNKKNNKKDRPNLEKINNNKVN